jgi:hypothetical protein
MVLIAADILVDREDAIAYKQLGKRPEGPALSLVYDLKKRLNREQGLTVQGGAHRWPC